jgi:hypothetical protein
MAPPLIQLKNIRLTFGGTPLLSGVELSVSSGERGTSRSSTVLADPSNASCCS